jgi:Family of unknown function (DUF6709)
MTDDWVAAKARRAAWRTVAVTAAALGVVLLVFAGQSRWIRNVFKGPFEISAAELSTIKGIWNSPVYFVRVTGTGPVDMGFALWNVETKNDVEVGRSVTAEYYSLAVGAKRLIVETAKLGSVQEPAVIGVLTAFPLRLRSRLERELGRASLRRDYYPFYLKAGSIRGQVVWFIGAAVLIVGALFLFVRPRLKILASPDENPLMNKIKTWGSPTQVYSDLEREWRMPADLKLGSWRITTSFLIRSGPFDFDVFRFEDILWAYETATRHWTYFIPIGSTYKAHLVFSNGKAVVRGRRKAVEKLLAMAAERAPWAIFGFSPETWARFHKDPQAVRQQVEQARREMTRR